jgi:stage III sporulation protein AA
VDEYYQAIRALPAWLASPLAQLPVQTAMRIQELRLRTGCAVTFTVQGRQCPASALPGCPPKLAAMRLNALQIEEIFYTLCNGSVHTHERELAEGYLTTAVGNRVGVAGQFVQREGHGITLQKVTSLNLRIARSCVIPLPPALDKLLEQHFTGLLVVGEPGSGKTTLLRTIARTLAERQRLVAVIDELFPPEGPLPPLERIGGVDKACAVQMALRTLAPQVILLDELGSLEETMALEQGFFSGVDFIASIHAPDAAQAQCRPQVQALLQRGMLRQLVILAGRETPGCIREVCAV